MLLPSQRELPKIPSEQIEVYLQQWLMVQLEYFYYKTNTYVETIANLEAINSFSSHFIGIHANMATNNAYYPILSKSEPELREFVKKLFKDKE